MGARTVGRASAVQCADATDQGQVEVRWGMGGGQVG